MGRQSAPSSKIFVDLVVVEAEDVLLQKQGTRKMLKKPFCYISTITQEIATSVVDQNTSNPIWNQDCTFTLYDEYEEITVELYDKRKKSKRVLLGQIYISLSEISFNKIEDVWKELQPPPSCDNKYLATGKIHLKIEKSNKLKKMFLSHYGTPTKDLPMRLNPGDLILVHSNALLPQTVRISTRSKWDHVAMVIQERNYDDLCLFEATMDGVEAYVLNTGLKYYRQNGKVAIRRVIIDRTDQFKKQLFDFVDEVIGRPYKQDWIQLIRATYNANEEDDLSSLFCSQLIAAAYQSLDLLSKGVHTNNFVPSDFANDLQGQLMGARLSDVRTIPSMSKKEPVNLKEQFVNKKEDGNVALNVGGARIQNVKFTETAMKRDNKLNFYTVFIINVTTSSGWSWILFKQVKDFFILDKELRKYFDNLPSLPKKSFGKIDQQSVHRKRVILQHYCRCLVRSPAVKCSILVNFFNEGKRGVFRNPAFEERIKNKRKHNKRKKCGSAVGTEVTSSSEKKKSQSPLVNKKRNTISEPQKIIQPQLSPAAVLSPDSQRRRGKQKLESVPSVAENGLSKDAQLSPAEASKRPEKMLKKSMDLSQTRRHSDHPKQKNPTSSNQNQTPSNVQTTESLALKSPKHSPRKRSNAESKKEASSPPGKEKGLKQEAGGDSNIKKEKEKERERERERDKKEKEKEKVEKEREKDKSLMSPVRDKSNKTKESAGSQAKAKEKTSLDTKGGKDKEVNKKSEKSKRENEKKPKAEENQDKKEAIVGTESTKKGGKESAEVGGRETESKSSPSRKDFKTTKSCDTGKIKRKKREILSTSSDDLKSKSRSRKESPLNSIFQSGDSANSAIPTIYWVPVKSPAGSKRSNLLTVTNNRTQEKLQNSDSQSYNVMFNVAESNDEPVSVDMKRRSFQEKGKRASVLFYLKKFNRTPSLIEIEEESDEEEDDDETVADLLSSRDDFDLQEELKRENITKLSEMMNVNLELLGIDDVDLADFELENLRPEASEVDIPDLLNEILGSVGIVEDELSSSLLQLMSSNDANANLVN